MNNSSLNSYEVSDIINSQIEILRKTAGEDKTIRITFNNGPVSIKYKSHSIPNENLIIFHGNSDGALVSLICNVSQTNFVLTVETDFGYQEIKNISF